MFTLCATTLASNILQVSLGTGHYLCRWGREKRSGVKAISDWLEGGGAKLVYEKVLEDSSSIARYNLGGSIGQNAHVKQ